MPKYYEEKFLKMLNVFMEYRWEKYGLRDAVLCLNQSGLNEVPTLSCEKEEFSPLNAFTGHKSRTNSLAELTTLWVKEHEEEFVRKWADVIRPWHFSRMPVGAWTITRNNVIITTNYQLARELTSRYVQELAKRRYGYEWMVFLRAIKQDFDMEVSDHLLGDEVTFNGGVMLQRVYGDRAPAALIDLFYNSDYKEKFPFLTTKIMREPRAVARMRIFMDAIPKRKLERLLTRSYVPK